MPWVIAIAAVAATAAAAASGGGGGNAPAPRNIGQETRDTLNAQVDLAPQLFASEAEFRPKYAALESDLLQRQLMGSPASKRMERYITGYETKPSTKRVVGYRTDGQQGMGGQAGLQRQPIYEGEDAMQIPIYGEREVDVPAQEGLLSLFESKVAPVSRRMEAEDSRARREADIRDVMEMGPEAVEAIRQANPKQAALIDRLMADAEEELGYGRRLSPSMRREVEQNVRGSQAARGFGYGPVDVFTEAMELGQAGEEMYARRKGDAAGAVGLSQNVYGDPFMAILGRGSNAGAASHALVGQAGGVSAGAGPRLFNPESGYASDVYNTNYNAEAAARISAANNRSALIGAGIGAMGSFGGGYLAGR